MCLKHWLPLHALLPHLRFPYLFFKLQPQRILKILLIFAEIIRGALLQIQLSAWFTNLEDLTCNTSPYTKHPPLLTLTSMAVHWFYYYLQNPNAATISVWLHFLKSNWSIWMSRFREEFSWGGHTFGTAAHGTAITLPGGSHLLHKARDCSVHLQGAFTVVESVLQTSVNLEIQAII